MKKIIATILMIAVILSLGFGILLFKPKKAKAFLGIGDITIDIVNELKDWVLDQLPKRVARYMMVRLQQEIARWAQGGFTDENKPFAMTSWKQEITDALNVASGRFVQEFGLTPLCAPIRVGLNDIFGLGLQPGYRVPYTEYAACTIGNIVDNVENFYKNPSIGIYGWDTWTALAQPQNNIFGSFLLAAERQAEIESEQIAEKEMQKDIGQGYKPEQECLIEQSMSEEEMQACRDDCSKNYPDDNNKFASCIVMCENKNTGICLEYKTKNIGSTIHSAIEKSIGSDIDWLISADEITEMFNLVFSGLFTKLIHGTGLTSTPFYRPSQTISKYQAQYSYYKSYQKAQTSDDRKKLRRDILDNILKSIQRITTNSYECDKDYQLQGDVLSEVAAEILDEESQHFYAGIEGVDLKPDFEVLDGPAAVNNGIAVYGQTWDDIAFSKYPPKCSEVAGIKCSNIYTGLPEDLSSDCFSTGINCVGRLNDIRINTCDNTHQQCLKQCTPDDEACTTKCNQERDACNENAYSQAVAEGACLNYNTAYSCLSQAWLIDGTNNRCNSCLKDGALCEGKGDLESKESCINEACDSFKNIGQPKSAFLNPNGNPIDVPGVPDGGDFSNKCSLKVKKDSCYVCLKEYFIPAQYCEVIYDFINRSFVKYPGQVYEDLWWGGFNNFDDCANSRTSSETIPVGLTCRVLPDFVFPNGGTCGPLCNVTPEELKDTSDDKPNDLDCGNGAQWRAGAYHPGGQYIPYLVRKRTKCCAALTGNNPDLYKKCRGITGDQPEEEPPPEEVETSCHDGESIHPYTGELSPDQGENREAFGTTNLTHTETGSPIIVPMINDGAYNDCAILRSQNPHATDVTVYITKPYCDAYRDLRPQKVYWSNLGGSEFTNSLVDIGGTHDGKRETVSYCCASPNTNSDGSNLLSCPGGFVSPPSDKIVCTFDIDAPVGSPNGPTGIDSITGEPYKACCGLSSYGVNNPSKDDCINAGVPAALCDKSDRFFSNGLYIVAVPDHPSSLGGADLCACENPSAGCGSTCSSASCP